MSRPRRPEWPGQSPAQCVAPTPSLRASRLISGMPNRRRDGARFPIAAAASQAAFHAKPRSRRRARSASPKSCRSSSLSPSIGVMIGCSSRVPLNGTIRSLSCLHPVWRKNLRWKHVPAAFRQMAKSGVTGSPRYQLACPPVPGLSDLALFGGKTLRHQFSVEPRIDGMPGSLSRPAISSCCVRP